MTLKNKYSEWAKLRIWNLGPAIQIAHENFNQFQRLDEEISKVSGNWTPADDNPRVYYTNSPWHAAHALAHLQHEAVTTRATHLLFRGQKRSTWDLSPTIDRLGSPEKVTRALMETWIFCNLMTKIGSSVLNINPAPGASFDLILPADSYLPVAQHYGLSTPLLDFTTDPAVAVFFASRDDIDAPEEFASVFVYQMPLKQDHRHLLNLRLPPPFIERPYLQKGIYMESAIPGDIGQQIPWDLEVRFPVRVENRCFSVVREEDMFILPESEEMGILLVYAKSGVSELIMENSGQIITPEMLTEFAVRYAKHHEKKLLHLFKKFIVLPDYIDHYVSNVEDMLYWLCYCPEETGLRINKDSFAAVVKGNPEICRMLLGYYRWIISISANRDLLSDPERNVKQTLIGMIEEILREMGRDPMSQPDLSGWFNK